MFGDDALELLAVGLDGQRLDLVQAMQLGLEVVVQRRPADTDRFGDVSPLAVLITLLTEKVDRRGEDVLALTARRTGWPSERRRCEAGAAAKLAHFQVNSQRTYRHHRRRNNHDAHRCHDQHQSTPLMLVAVCALESDVTSLSDASKTPRCSTRGSPPGTRSPTRGRRPREAGSAAALADDASTTGQGLAR